MAPYHLPTDAVWLVTGCSSGIGQALCEHLLSQTTSRVVATARNVNSLSTLPETTNVLKLPLDVTDENSIRAAIATAASHYGRIDVVVNNAGFGLMGDTETIDMKKAREMMNANFWGAVHITQLALPILRDENPNSGQRGGLIMQITSMGGRLAFAGNTFYHASKFALEGFTEGLAKELPPDWNIHFLCVEPGGVKTKWAETSTSGFDAKNRHAAYTHPEMPTNQLLKYKESKEATANWAEPEKVVEVLYNVVSGGLNVPLRLPLGSDSWGMQKMALEQGLVDLKEVEKISNSTSSEAQLKSIEFLSK